MECAEIRDYACSGQYLWLVECCFTVGLLGTGAQDGHLHYGTRGPGEIKRREVVRDPQVSREEIKSREVELGDGDELMLNVLRCHLTY